MLRNMVKQNNTTNNLEKIIRNSFGNQQSFGNLSTSKGDRLKSPIGSAATLNM